MISFSKLGHKGRLGNQLFQIASTIGIAAKNATFASFPKWEYDKYFKLNISDDDFKAYNTEIKEREFCYNDISLPCMGNYDLNGYFQSAKYWKDKESQIKALFDFTDELTNKSLENLPHNGKQNIAIHIRRGDYVGNPSHYNLSIRYYLNALNRFDWKNHNLCFFSDDIEFAKWHFSCLPDSYFIHNSEIEDLCTMTLCDHFIIANSSFSWWAAYLCRNDGKIVVRPTEHFAGNQLKLDIKDIYPIDWISVSDNIKLDLKDTEFIIPVKFDHNDRMANLNLSIQHIQQNFDANIHVIEQGGTKFSYVEDFAKYTFVTYQQFHRTKMINLGVKHSKCDHIVNWDADMVLNPVQLWYSVKLLRAGIDIIYPYDGNFKTVPRKEHINLATNLYYLVGKIYSGPIESWGGAIFCNRSRFIEAGMENERFISWGPEDAERFVRFQKMGLSIERLKGSIYHLEHYRGVDSGRMNRHLAANRKEWHMIRLMPNEDLKKYVKTWQWTSFT